MILLSIWSVSACLTAGNKFFLLLLLLACRHRLTDVREDDKMLLSYSKFSPRFSLLSLLVEKEGTGDRLKSLV